MRVYISVDMEGVAGVATREQCRRNDPSYAAAARLMSLETNAAVLGAFDAGATHVLVNDAHAEMWNLDTDCIDPRADVVVGSPKVPASMAYGVEGHDVALFVGYHASAGVAGGCLAHTYSGACFADVLLDGEVVTEAELNARYAGAGGVPLGLVTGDSALADELAVRMPGTTVLAVKNSLGRTAVSSMHPVRAREAIRAAAARAVDGATTLQPFNPPVSELRIDLIHGGMAELCALVPGTHRIAGRTVVREVADIAEAHQVLHAWMYLASEAL